MLRVTWNRSQALHQAFRRRMPEDIRTAAKMLTMSALLVCKWAVLAVSCRSVGLQGRQYSMCSNIDMGLMVFLDASQSSRFSLVFPLQATSGYKLRELQGRKESGARLNASPL